MNKILTLHHAASSGGSMLCKYLQKHLNCVLLSEINYSAYWKLMPAMSKGQAQVFSPCDMIRKYWEVTGRALDDFGSSRFKVDLQRILEDLSPGQSLIIRDWTHCDFFMGAHLAKSSLLTSLKENNFISSCVVTVRHPLESYCSLKNNHAYYAHDIVDLDDYSARYLNMLDALPYDYLYYYERACLDISGFVEDVSRRNGLCIISDKFNYDISCEAITGDSGRRASAALLRTAKDWRRYIDSREVHASSSYKELCDRLGYNQLLRPGTKDYFVPKLYDQS